MRILFVSSQALFRDTRFGGAKRLYYLAKALEKHAEIKMVCLDGCREPGAGSRVLSEFSPAMFVPDPESVSWLDHLRFLPGVRRALVDHREKLRRFIGREPVDVVVLAYPSALRFLSDGLLPPARRIVYIEDDLILEQWRLRAQTSTRLSERVRFGLRRLQGLAFYRRHGRGITDIACITPQELDIMRGLLPEIPAWLLEYGMPLAEYPVTPESGPLSALGFIGNYNHSPNVDAALWLLRELFPAAQAASADARLVLCGTGVPEVVRAEARRNPAVELIENVPRLSDFYGRISVFVNPLREGRGLRTKVLEAAAFGRPVVSTALGKEGLDDLEIPVFRNAPELLSTLEGMKSVAERAKIAERNRRIVEAKYSIESVARDLLARLAP